MSISLIIPVYNEVKEIDRCLDNVETLMPEPKVLFADGGSTDLTREHIIARGFKVISSTKGRSAQMNAAAAQADGDILWFSHSDSILPADGCREIEYGVNRGAVFGCFHIAFDYDGPFMNCCTALSNRRAIRGRIAFGDQGIFVQKELFLQIGGFPDLPLMEDYEFSRRMKRERIPLTVLPGTITTSGRRYRQQNPLLVMWQMYCLRSRYRHGGDLQEIARQYRDIR